MTTRTGRVNALPAFALVVACAWSAPAVAEGWQTFGDARLLFFASERQPRAARATTAAGAPPRRGRGAETGRGDPGRRRGRAAARFTTDQDRSRFWLKSWGPSRTGLEDGDATVDQLFLRYEAEGGDWSVRIGRFQSNFTLADLTTKSLDRNDSSNVAITWTDGVHWRQALTPAWQSHLILQGNASRGSGMTARVPLSFDDDDSRVTVFGALESTERWGPVKQRVISMTWIPAALATDGISAPRRQDYVALTARAAAEWPIGDAGMRGLLGVEFGYAPNTPQNTVMNSGDDGSAGGTAKQFAMTLFDIAPGHDLGFVYGVLNPGWLISPNYRPNDLALEIRYHWRISKTLGLESRLRRREERQLPSSAERPRIDDDFYLRFSLRF